MKYTATVCEKVMYEIEVDATSYDEAMEIAMSSYSNTEPVTYDCDVNLEEEEN